MGRRLMPPLRPTVRQLAPRRSARSLRARLALAAAAALALLAAVAVAAWSADWKDGDVLVGLNTGSCNGYASVGTLTDTIEQGFAVDCAFDRSGVLHTTAFASARPVRFLAP